MEPVVDLEQGMRGLSRIPSRIINGASGKVEVRGLRLAIFSDLYYILLNRPWRYFYLLTISAYAGLNAIFAVLYMVGGDCIGNAAPDDFLAHLWFSVQTMNTIGYGFMYPKTNYAHTLVALQSLVGMLSVATITGLAFAKFSKPRARVIFSKRAVIAMHDGIPTFMFRMGNARANLIAEASLSVVVLRRGKTKEGRFFNRMADLTLARDKSPLFTLTWTALHPITDFSPIKAETPASMREQGIQFICSLVGSDGSTGQTFHARHEYKAEDIHFGMRLVDVLSAREHNVPLLNYQHFHDVEPDTGAAPA